ncbi:MAG TPA: hypothetical protein VHB97_16900 [Polyangia bacterium]|nr:hypothetical protein [Polyangia bacterium]
MAGALIGCSTPAEIACLDGQAPCHGACIDSATICPGVPPNTTADMNMTGGGDMAVGAMCNVASCPVPTTACKSATCINDACGTTVAVLGTPCNDSGGNVCDGNGTCMPGCASPADCTPITTTACQANLCNPTVFMCMVEDAPQDTPCNDSGGAVCDGSGACVGCVLSSDCAPSSNPCVVVGCDTMMHTCGTAPAPPNTPCNIDGGTICDGEGNCVQAP